MQRAQNTVKRGSFWRGGVGRRQGARPLSPTERRETPSAMPRPGGPWPDLSAYARQPARGPTMLAHRVAICWPMLAYVGLSCGQRGPILWLCWPMFASCWPMLSQKIRKMGTAKNAVKRRIFDGRRPILGLCWPILGLCRPILRAMLAHLGAMLAHLGAMLAHLEAYVGPSWGYVGPS